MAGLVRYILQYACFMSLSIGAGSHLFLLLSTNVDQAIVDDGRQAFLWACFVMLLLVAMNMLLKKRWFYISQEMGVWRGIGTGVTYAMVAYPLLVALYYVPLGMFMQCSEPDCLEADMHIARWMLSLYLPMTLLLPLVMIAMKRKYAPRNHA